MAQAVQLVTARTVLAGAPQRVRYGWNDPVDGGPASPVTIVTDADIAAGRAAMPTMAVQATVRVHTDRHVQAGPALPIYIEHDPPLLRPEDVVRDVSGGVWYDDQRVFADTAGTTPAELGTAVASWFPVAGTLPAWTQTTSTRRPVRDFTGVVFDGSDDVLLMSSTALNAQSRTVLAVLAAPAASATRPWVSSGAANWYVGQTGGSGLDGRLISNWQDASLVTRTLATSVVVPACDATPHGYAWRHTTSGSTVTIDHWRDASLLATTTRTDGMASTAHATWYLGAFASGSLHGMWTVRALAIVLTSLSVAQIGGILAYWRIVFGW